MTEGLDPISALADVSFIDNMTLPQCQDFLIGRYQENYKNITGRNIVLQKADPRRIELLGVAQLMYQALQYVDRAGKMNLLKYAYGDYLDHLGAFKKAERTGAQPATAKVSFVLAEARSSATGINAGTTVTADQKIFFATTEYAEIPAGETSITLVLTCTTAGKAGNGYAPGEISILCDPVSFVSQVRNIEETRGGAESLSDDDYREKIYMAPSGYSSAGSDNAWVVLLKNRFPEVGDARVWPGSAGSTVNICIMLKNGIIPPDEFLKMAADYLNSPGIRPVTDLVKVQPPDKTDYSIEATYYIPESKKEIAGSIQEAVKQAVYGYVCWQGAHDGKITTPDKLMAAKVGRDINPDKLTEKAGAAGAKRIVITSPVYQEISRHGIANLKNRDDGEPDITLVYGGIESD